MFSVVTVQCLPVGRTEDHPKHKAGGALWSLPNFPLWMCSMCSWSLRKATVKQETQCSAVLLSVMPTLIAYSPFKCWCPIASYFAVARRSLLFFPGSFILVLGIPSGVSLKAVVFRCWVSSQQHLPAVQCPCSPPSSPAYWACNVCCRNAFTRSVLLEHL